MHVLRNLAQPDKTGKRHDEADVDNEQSDGKRLRRHGADRRRSNLAGLFGNAHQTVPVRMRQGVASELFNQFRKALSSSIGDAALFEILPNNHRQGGDAPIVACLRDIAIARDTVDNLADVLLSLDRELGRIFIVPDHRFFNSVRIFVEDVAAFSQALRSWSYPTRNVNYFRDTVE